MQQFMETMASTEVMISRLKREYPVDVIDEVAIEPSSFFINSRARWIQLPSLLCLFDDTFADIASRQVSSHRPRLLALLHLHSCTYNYLASVHPVAPGFELT